MKSKPVVILKLSIAAANGIRDILHWAGAKKMFEVDHGLTAFPKSARREVEMIGKINAYIKKRIKRAR